MAGLAYEYNTKQRTPLLSVALTAGECNEKRYSSEISFGHDAIDTIVGSNSTKYNVHNALKYTNEIQLHIQRKAICLINVLIHKLERDTQP